MEEFRYIFQCLKCKERFSYTVDEFKKMITGPEIICPKCGSDMMLQENCPEPTETLEEKLKKLEEAVDWDYVNSLPED